MPADSGRKYSPPYISPRTFRSLLVDLGKSPPDRIDRSYLGTMHSHGNSTQLLTALRFLNLVDPSNNNKPTHYLRLLLDATGDEKVKRLREVVNNAFGQVLNGGAVNPQTCTYAQLEEAFRDVYGVDSADVRRKCIKFFASIAEDAGMVLSPHVTGKLRGNGGATAAPRPATKRSIARSSRTVEVPQAPAQVPEHSILLDKLIGKLPDFDPKWSAEERMLWLESFQLFVQQFYPGAKK